MTIAPDFLASTASQILGGEFVAYVATQPGYDIIAMSVAENWIGTELIDYVAYDAVTHSVYTAPNGVAYIEVPDDHELPDNAAHRAMMLYLAVEEQKSGETIIQARARMRDYLKESPLVDVTEAQFALSGPRPVRIYRET